MQMGGATVLRGPMGFGKSSHLHTAKILRLSIDLPIVIEIVDSEDKVNAFLPVLDEIMGRRTGHTRKSQGDPLSGSAKKRITPKR
jgi:PII-like signaling protein